MALSRCTILCIYFTLEHETAMSWVWAAVQENTLSRMNVYPLLFTELTYACTRLRTSMDLCNTIHVWLVSVVRNWFFEPTGLEQKTCIVHYITHSAFKTQTCYEFTTGSRVPGSGTNFRLVIKVHKPSLLIGILSTELHHGCHSDLTMGDDQAGVTSHPDRSWGSPLRSAPGTTIQWC